MHTDAVPNQGAYFAVDFSKVAAMSGMSHLRKLRCSRGALEPGWSWGDGTLIFHKE
jgi:hypothetical protein